MTRRVRTLPNRTSHSASGFPDTSAPRHWCSLRTIGAALFPPPVVLFVGFFAWYLYAVVDMRLVFQARDNLFLWNLDYFTDFIGQPGSLLEWVDNLLVQLCYDGWSGTIAVAAAAWLLLVSTIGFMNASGHAGAGGTWVIPGILLIALCGNYSFHASVVVSLALAMTAANGWCRILVGRPWLRPTVFVLVSAPLYYVADVAWYVFAACCVVYEALVEKRRVSGIFLALAAVGVKFGIDAALAHLNLATLNFQVPSDRNTATHPHWCLILLYGYFPACALFLAYRHAIYAYGKNSWPRRAEG